MCVCTLTTFERTAETCLDFVNWLFFRLRRFHTMSKLSSQMKTYRIEYYIQLLVNTIFFYQQTSIIIYTIIIIQWLHEYFFSTSFWKRFKPSNIGILTNVVKRPKYCSYPTFNLYRYFYMYPLPSKFIACTCLSAIQYNNRGQGWNMITHLFILKKKIALNNDKHYPFHFIFLYLLGMIFHNKSYLFISFFNAKWRVLNIIIVFYIPYHEVTMKMH